MTRQRAKCAKAGAGAAGGNNLGHSTVTRDDVSGTARSSVKRTRTTVTLDDDLIRAAQALTGIKEKSALIRAALKQLVRAGAPKRLAALGGAMPDLQRIPRRQVQRK